MSTASAAGKPGQPAAQGGYSVARPGGKCTITGAEIAPGEKFMAMLKESPTGLERIDVSMDAWKDAPKDDALAFWQTVMPRPEQTKKKLFVDDEVLCTLFERLAETQEELKLHFRFVLGLILIRKRQLIYEGNESHDGHDYWVVRFKGREERMSMLDPKLNEEQVKAVSSQLSEIMNEEL